jgi:hypothetical protein
MTWLPQRETVNQAGAKRAPFARRQATGNTENNRDARGEQRNRRKSASLREDRPGPTIRAVVRWSAPLTA